MIPEVSKLNWSYEKPTFEEVEGAALLIVNDNDELPEVIGIVNKTEYEYWFNDPDCPFTKMAIVEMPLPDPEPLPLWGVEADANLDADKNFYFSYVGHGCSFIFQSYPTRSEAITAWNRIATALNEIGEK